MIRISGGVGGMLIVAVFGLAVAGIVTAILSWIGRLFGKNAAAKKVISILCGIVWIVCIAAILLDLFNVMPIIRNILFALLGS